MSVIGFFDTTKDVVLQVDVFHVGLGAVWIHDGKSGKVKYAVIEKVMLEIVCEY